MNETLVTSKSSEEVITKKPLLSGKRTGQILGILACVAMCSLNIYCDDPTAENLIKNMVDQITKMLRYVGIIVAVIGMGKFALAMKDDNPDGQARAAYYAIAGAILIGIGPIISALGLF